MLGSIGALPRWSTHHYDVDDNNGDNHNQIAFHTQHYFVAKNRRWYQGKGSKIKIGNTILFPLFYDPSLSRHIRISLGAGCLQNADKMQTAIPAQISLKQIQSWGQIKLDQLSAHHHFFVQMHQFLGRMHWVEVWGYAKSSHCKVYNCSAFLV